jgi:hypothetical protein
MAVLSIKWETLSKLPQLVQPVITSEEGTPASAPSDEAAPKALDKPYLVYITDPAATVGYDTVEKVVLTDDRIVIGTHAFHAVKMSPEDANADPLLGEKGGKALPRIVLVTSDLKTVTALEKTRLSVSGTWEAMKATANKHYKENLDTVVKGLRDVLTDFDRVNSERKVLDDKEQRKGGATELSKADKKDIDAKRAELDARQKKAEARQAELEKMNPKLAA